VEHTSPSSNVLFFSVLFLCLGVLGFLENSSEILGLGFHLKEAKKTRVWKKPRGARSMVKEDKRRRYLALVGDKW
jgi:hypothetical protein